MNLTRLAALSFLSVFISATALSQPVWVPGTPAISDLGALSIDVDFGIDREGIVYIIIFNSNVTAALTSNQVKTYANSGPSGGMVVAVAINVNGGDINTILQQYFDLFDPNRAHAMYIVAESNPGGLQGTPIRIAFTTPACPAIDMDFGYVQPEECINLGATLTLRFTIFDADPDVSGVYPGTEYFIDWGDGNTTTWVSTDVQPQPFIPQTFSHTYLTNVDCNYEVYATVTSACNPMIVKQFSTAAIIHGRDILSDGDGFLELVNNDGGSTVIEVCEGTETTIFLRDNSVWNCQDPTFMNGDPAPANTDPRALEWIYGEDPGGAITNTITGNVAISNLGNANSSGGQTSGRYEPMPNQPGEISESITIPATSVAGQYFRVYLKNWNKCNWADPDYIDTYIDILIVDAPDAPTIDDLPICEGESTLLDPSSTPIGEFHWYDDGMNFITAGDTYDPGLTAPGVYTYYVTDQQLVGDLCESPPTEVTITINPIPNQPTISRDNGDFCYDGVSSITLTADPGSPPAVAYYQWYRDGTPVGGETSNTITLTEINQSGEYTVRSYGIAPTNCPSPLSDPVDVLIGQPAIVNAGPATATICSNTPYNTNGSFGGGATSATWSTSGDGTFGNIGDMTTTYTPGSGDIASGTVTITLTTNDPGGPCPAVSDNILLTVVPAPAANAGADVAICESDIYTVTDATASNYNTITWTENGAGSITSGANTLAPTYTPGAGDAGNSVTLTLTATGNGPCSTVADSKVIDIDRTPVATVGGIQELCNTATANLQGNSGGNDLLSNASGEWTFINNLVWQETFSESPDGSTSGAQWTNSLITPDADTYFHTENHRMVGRGLPGEVEWTSEVIDISSFSSVKASVSVAETGNAEAADYVRVYYRLNGAAPQFFTTNGNNIDDFTSRIASVAGLSGSTLQIVIRVRNNVSNEYHYFDNIVVREEAASPEPVITTPSSATSGVTGLWQGDNLFRWSVFSENNGCDSVSAVHIIRRDVSPAAAAAGSNQEECETSTFTLNGNTPTNGGTGLWTVSAGFTGTITDNTNPGTTVTGVNYGTHTFTWTISSALGICSSSADAMLLTRNEDPAPTASFDAGPHCYSATTTITGSPNLGAGASSVTTHLWTGSGAAYLSATDVQNPVFTAPSVLAPQDFQLIYTVTDNNGCTGTSVTYTISVYPHVQSATIGSDHSICANATTNIQVAIVGGTGPYTVVYTATDINGTNTYTENGYSSGLDIATASLDEDTTFELVSVTDANGCTATSLIGTAVVTVGVLPDRATIVPVATPLCEGVNAQLQIQIYDGVPPFLVDIDNIAGTITVNGYSHTIDLGTALAPGSHDYNITSIEDACNNFFTDLGTTATVVVNSSPDLSDLSTSFCSDAQSGVNLAIDNPAAFGILSVTYNITNIVSNGLSASNGSPTTGTALPANVLANDAWTNRTASDVDVVYTIVPVSDKGCTGPAADITFTIQPEPDLNVADIDICSGEATAINLTDVHTIAVSYNITAIDMNGLSATAGSPATGNGLAAGVISDDAYLNLTGADVDVEYTVVPVSVNGCAGDPEIITITVQSEPDLNVSDVTVCSDGATGITLADVEGIASEYNITAINANGLTASAGSPATGTGLAANVIANDAWTNVTGAPVDVVYTVVPVSGNGCEGAAEDITVTVNPEPVLSNLSNTVCSDEAVAITLSDVDGIAASYNITNINANGLTASGGTPSTGSGLAAGVIADDRWTNRTSSDVNVVYTISPVSGNSCVGDARTVTVTVQPEPDLNVADIDICSGEATGITLTDVHSIAVSYNITAIDMNGLSATAGNPATGNALAAGVIADDAYLNLTGADVDVEYTVVPVSVNGCAGDPEVITVTVHPQPDLNVSDATICSDGATGITLSDVDGIASEYNITAINANGLTASAGSPSTGTGLAANVIANDAWTNVTGAPVDVIYTVVPVSANGCEGAAEDITVTINPEPVLSNLSNTVCSDEAVAITLSDVDGIATSYNITNINANGLTASGGTPATGNGLAAGVIADDRWTNRTASDVNVVYTISPVSGNSCVGDARTVTVTVQPEPDLNVADIDICSGEATGITLTDVHSIAVSYNITAIDMNGLSATAGNPATGNALVAGVIADDAYLNLTGADVDVEYTVVPVSVNGCAGDPEVITVTVHPEPILATLDKTLCSGNITAVTLSATNVAADLFEIVAIRVDAGITPSGTNATVGVDRPASAIYNDVFTNTTGSILTVEYDIIPKVSATGCTGDMVTVTMTVGAEPVLDPSLDDFACSDDAISLVLAEATGSVPPNYYNIISVTIDPALVAGAGNATVPEPNAAADYLQNDTYTNLTGINRDVVYRVQPMIAADCYGDPVDITITVRPEPIIVPGQTAIACSGESIDMEILLAPLNTPAGTTFSWPVPTMDDGSVQGTAQSGVAADPDGTAHITDALVNYSGTPITATYYVTPESQFGCEGTTVPVVVTINPEPPANPINGRDQLCAGETSVVYTVASHAGSTYNWTVPASVGTVIFDFNTNAIIINAAASAGSGDISVVEINSWGCSSEPNIITVQVYDPVGSEDITGDNNVCAYETTTYSVPFNAGSTYSWGIPPGAAIQGDPSAHEVTITFGVNGGTISVRETISAGCITDHNPFAVTVEPLPTAVISNGGIICVEGSQPLQVNLSGSGDYTFVYALNGIDQPAVTTTDDPYTLDVNAAGTYTITSVTDNITGCTNTGSGSAVVSFHPVPTGTVTGTTDICEGESTVVTLTFTGAPPFNFEYTDGVTPVTVAGHNSAVYTFTVSPAVTTTYTLVSLSDANGCNGTVSGMAEVTVNERPLLTLVPANLDCFGDSSGEIEMTVTGSAPFSYSWTGPSGFTANTEDITGLAAGTYNVTVTDVNGCTSTTSQIITQPAVLDLSSSGNVALLCNGDATATGTFTVTGGTAPYTFTTVSNSAGATVNAAVGATIDFTGGGAGEVTIEVTDVNGCTDQAVITITEPAAIAVSAALSVSPEGSHNISCYGGSNGSIQLTVSGGTAPYVYAWTTADGSGLNAADNGTQTGLTAGTYDVTITDNNGCTYSDSYTLTEPPALSVTVSADDYIIGNCPTSDALLTGVATGGVELSGGGYIYSWSPAGGLGDPASDITTAKPSSTVTYTLTVTDANGCTASDNLQIEVRPSLTAVAFADDNIIGTCPLSVANLDVNVNGGEELGGGGYSYSWSPTAGLDDPTSKTPEANPVATTTYTVTVTDANGCQTTSSVTITVAPDLAVTATVDDPLIGECPGSKARLDATVTGGEGGYTYLWDNAGTLDDPTLRNPEAKPLVPTTYTVTVTDANGCSAINSVFVDVAPPLTAIASADDDILSTCPTSVANMDVTVNGGEGPFTYSWSPTAGLSDPFRSDPVAKPGSSTTYTVTVTDANGCQATDNILITVQPPLTATATADDYIISTCSTSVAVLDVAVSGGEAGYTYLWDNAATLDDPTSATPVAKPASTTIYTVTVTDVNGCETIASVTIIVQPDLVATATADDYTIGTCPGSDATLNVTAFGGEQLGGGGYAYSWTPAASLDDATSKNPVAKPLVTTTYTVTVTDLNGCTTTADVTINVADPLAVTATASDNLIGTCPSSTSTLMATMTGGEGGFTYVWDNAATLDDPNKINPVAKPAVTTTYSVTVTDANGCMATGSVTVNVAPDLTATALADDDILSTCPTSVANLDVTVNGGEPGYTYRWSPTAGLDDPYIQTPVAKPAATTTYTVQVTDANGCITTSQIVITVQPPLTAAVTADDYIIGTCPGSVSNLEVTASGGEELGGGGYTYSWSPALSLDDATSRTPQADPDVTTTYTVTVTDANGCTTMADVIIEVRPDLVATAIADDYIIGTCSGSVSNLDVTITGGEAGYTYSWSPVTGLDDPTIANPEAKPGVTTTYTVTVTDANGCIATDDIEIVVQPDLTVTASADDYLIGTCPSSVALLDAVASGGEELAGGGYTYLWSPSTGLSSTSSATPTAKPAATTTYTVTVTDRNGCIATDMITITVADPLTATASADDNIIGSCPGSSATLSVVAAGGEELVGGGYTYLWSPAADLDDPTSASPVATPSVTTTYMVTVTDANGCTATANITVQVASPLNLSVMANDYLIGTCVGSESQLTATAYGGEELSGGGYSWSWSPVAGLDDATSRTPVAKPLVTTTYTVTVTDANGCQVSDDIEIVVAPDLSATATTDDPLISTCPTSRANLDVNVTGGEELPGGGYTYSWAPAAGLTNPFSRNPVAKPAATTTYTVTVTDANGCTTTSDVLITVADPIVISHTAVVYNGGWNVSCQGEADGGIDITVTGGEVPYGFAWSGPAGFTSTDEDISGLTAGIYLLTVTDANGCFATYSVTLTSPDVLEADAVVSSDYNGRDVSCFGEADGSIDLTVTGGTAPYNYSWTGPGVWTSTDEDPSLLTAGTYNVTVTDDNGCIATAVISLSQPDLLELNPTNNQLLDCFGDNDGYGTFYALGGTMPYTFTEVTNSAGATLAAAGMNSQGIFGASAGEVTIRVTDVNGCSAEATILFTQPDPLSPGVIGSDQVVCFDDDPAPITATTPASGGTGTYTYQWQMTTIAGGPYTNIPGATDASYDPPAGATMTTWYRREVRTGICAPEYTNPVEIVVNPLPLALITGGGTICPGENAFIRITMSQGTGPFRLNIDGLGIVNNYSSGVDLPVSPAVTTTYTLISVEDANGCVVTEATYPAFLNGSATVTVRDNPVITRDPYDVTLCEYNMTGFGVTATGTDLIYQWEVYDGSSWSDVSDGGTYFGANSDSLMIFSATRSLSGNLYRVKATTCGITVTSADAELTIETAPEIINHPQDTTICVGNDAWMDVDAVGDGLTYQWYVNTGAGFVPVADDGINYSGATTDSLVIMDAPSIFTSDLFRVVVSGTCGVPVYSGFSILTVSNPPVATLDPLDDEICEDGNVYFVANGYGMDSIRWQVDDGSGWTELYDDVNHLGSASPQLTIIDVPLSLNGNMYRLALYNECDVTFTAAANLTVNENPVVDFSTIDPLLACGGVPLQLNGNPAGGSGSYVSHRWTGQVGPLNNYFIEDPLFNTSIQGSYALNYAVTDSKGCAAEGSVTVEVERPTASFAPDVTSGCPDLTINFTDNSVGAVIYRWDFGDGTAIDNTAGDVSHTYTNASTSLLYYNVKLEVESANGCLDSMVMGVTVYPEASADFTLSADTVCAGEQVILTSLPGAYQYHWDYGDGVAEYGSNVISHVFANATTAPVTYTIRLTTTSFYSCDAWIEKDIVVYPTPVPLFSANPPSQVYPNATVSFTNLTNAGTWDYLWRFDDGNTSTETNPVHTYADPGNYNVYLIVTNGECSDSINRLIQVLPTPPIASFDSVPGACSPSTITLNNTSLYATSYMWEFGDGAVSYAANPTYTYYEHGTYRITLTATGPGGTHVFSRLVEVYETPRAYFEVAPSRVFVDDERVRGFNLSEGADYYIWEWGDGDTSMVKDPYHRYMREGLYDVTLHAYSNNGCYNSYTLSPGVTVVPAGDIRFANVFRPNKEGPNGGDVTNLPADQVDIVFFPPVKDQVDNYKLQIFNRAGVLIFESNDINIGWDGYYNGRLCMQGVYVWYVEGNYANGKPYKKVGDITLLH